MHVSAIGYFSKTHGVKGHLVLRAEADFETEGLTAVFCETATGKAPYFISEFRETNQGIIVKLEEINAVEQAKTLIGKQVYIDSKLLIAEEGDGDLIGFELIDENFGSLGKVSDVTNNGFQDLLTVNYKGKEVILPLVEEFIKSIDEDKKVISFLAPEGLIELYLADETSEEE